MNCKTELINRFCHVCGQENLEPKETVWHLVQHFFNDITHFDGKFFASVKYLIRKPGFLSKEYMAGRRASYLNPIRMYVFSSAIFFLLLFSLKKPDEMIHINNGEKKTEKLRTYAELRSDRERLARDLAGEEDEDDRGVLKSQITKLDMEMAAIRRFYSDTTTRGFDKTDLGLLLLRALRDSVSVGTPEEETRKYDTALANRIAALRHVTGDAAKQGKKELLAKTGDTGTYRYKGPGLRSADSAGKERKGLAAKAGDKLAKLDDKRLAKKKEEEQKKAGITDTAVKKGKSSGDEGAEGLDKIGEEIGKKAENAGEKIGKAFGDNAGESAGEKSGEKEGGKPGEKAGGEAKDGDEDLDLHVFGIFVGQYKTVADYDSAQARLPADQRDGWVTRQATKKLIVAQAQIRVDKERYLELFVEHLLHSIPKILFISLPLFAMILNILYFRQKKTFYYVSHGIFTIHVYCATFLLSMAIILLNKLYEATDLKLVHFFTGLLIFLIVLYLLIYLYKAMRGFYGQGRFKTLVKYFITFWVAFIINTILLVLFILISAISI